MGVLNLMVPHGLGLPLADNLVRWNLEYSYGPLNTFLTEVVAPRVPLVVSPNTVTMLSTAMLLPVLAALSRGWVVFAALLVFVHDMLDRLDGSLARFRKSKDHDPRFGAFLDAQGDKIFHVGFLVFNLVLHSRQVGMLYFVLGLLVVVVQSLSFFVRCMDYFAPIDEKPDGLKAAGEGKLATTLCNSAALVACLNLRYQDAPLLTALTVIMLYMSLDLALRSVKIKLINRSGAMETGVFLDDGEETLFSLIVEGQKLYYYVVEAPVLWLTKKRAFPGTIQFLGTQLGIVTLLQGLCMLVAVPFLFAVKHHMPALAVGLIVVFHYALGFCQVVANRQLHKKALTHYLFNFSQFLHYVCLRLFGLVSLWSLWAASRINLWSWRDYFIITGLLAAYCFYGISLLIVRVDDTMPHHPATVAAWARIGGPGVASGVSKWGIIRERIQPFALVFVTLTMMDQSLFARWYGYAAVCCIVLILLLNHSDLKGKLRVRSLTQKHTTTAINTLAEQDVSLAKEREEAPDYDVVVTIGCFDLFHEGHVKLMQRMRSFGRRLLVGLHDDESINLLKGRFPVDNVVKRLQNVKRYADQVFVIPSTDPSPYLDAAVDRSIPKERMCFIRGADMPNFPGRPIAEQLMKIKLTPYTEGVSSTLLRQKLTERVEGSAYDFSGGALIWFQDAWLNINNEPPGTGWIQYGSDYFRFRTSESSPTIW